MTSKIFLTVDDACSYLRLKSRGALYQRIRRGPIPAPGCIGSPRVVATELSKPDAVEARDVRDR